MSDGQQLEFPEDEMNWPYEQLHGDYHGGVIKEGHMAFVLSKPVDDSLEGIKLVTSPGFDEKMNALGEKTEIQIEFE